MELINFQIMVLILLKDRAFQIMINPIALRMAKTPWSFGHSECIRVNLTKRQGFSQTNIPPGACI